MRTGKLSAESLRKISGFNLSGPDFGPGVTVIGIDLTDTGDGLGNLLEKLVRSMSLDTADLAGTINIAEMLRPRPTPPTKLDRIFKKVYNRCSKETENFLYSTIQELGMNVKNVVLVFGERNSAGKYGDDSYVLFLDESLDFESRQFIILHELRHIQQCQREWLVCSNASPTGRLYKGRPVQADPKKHVSNVSYCMEPHELDANLFAMSYFKGNLDNVNSGVNAIGVAKQYLRHNQWFESIGVP